MRIAKFHPIAGHEGREGGGGVEVQLHCFFNLGARWRWVVSATPRPLYLREWPSTYCTGDWVGPRMGEENLVASPGAN